jgi:hypothetical protein
VSKTQKKVAAERAALAYQFEQEAIRLQVRIQERYTNFRYSLLDLRTGNTIGLAILLPETFDYYEFRLNVTKVRYDMLIVSRHNAVVPVQVLDLQTVYSYAPLEAPTLTRTGAKQRSKEEANLLLSKYILNFESATEELAALDIRTRQRYAVKRAAYLKPRRGRPWSS